LLLGGGGLVVILGLGGDLVGVVGLGGCSWLGGSLGWSLGG